MPVFERESRYPYPRSTVFAWHTRPGAFVRLTPPGMATLLEGPTDGINPGSTLRLRISHPVLAALAPRGRRSGPPGVTWVVRHSELDDGVRFVDEQVRGPFRHWRHVHTFTDGPAGSTILVDRVEWELPRAARALAPLVELQLEALFAFRENQLRGDLALHDRLPTAPRTVAISGATGLIGRQVGALLTTGGHRVIRLVRGSAGGVDETRWDPGVGCIPRGALDGVDVAVNLSGRSIGGRFTRAHTDGILLSRLSASTTLARALAQEAPDAALIQASAIGYYGARRPGEILSEDSSPGTGVLAEVVRLWEASAQPARRAGLRTVLMRTGIVLTEGGGALAPQIPLFALGMGGRLAAAQAWMSWITLDDIARSYVHAALTDGLDGPVNVVGPRPVTNETFAATLGRVLHRPARIATPAVGPTAVLGREGYDQLINTDQRVSSRRLEDSGFRFAHQNLFDALCHVLLR